MTKSDPVAESERAKYQKMWALPSYRETSPGLNIASLALEKLGCQPGDDILDFGCGEGKVVDWFHSREINALGIDIVALRPDIIEGCLWDLPKDIVPAAFVFCASVLEPLQPEKIDAVLETIKEHADVAAFLTIATIGCIQGERHGETLHLTVKPIQWWEDKLKFLWPHVTIGQGDRKWRYWALVRQ